MTCYLYAMAMLKAVWKEVNICCGDTPVARRIEELGLLSKVEELGLLEQARMISGLTLSKIEQSGLLSKAEKSGV